MGGVGSLKAVASAHIARQLIGLLSRYALTVARAAVLLRVRVRGEPGLAGVPHREERRLRAPAVSDESPVVLLVAEVVERVGGGPRRNRPPTDLDLRRPPCL